MVTLPSSVAAAASTLGQPPLSPATPAVALSPGSNFRTPRGWHRALSEPEPAPSKVTRSPSERHEQATRSGQQTSELLTHSDSHSDRRTDDEFSSLSCHADPGHAHLRGPSFRGDLVTHPQKQGLHPKYLCLLLGKPEGVRRLSWWQGPATDAARVQGGVCEQLPSGPSHTLPLASTSCPGGRFPGEPALGTSR